MSLRAGTLDRRVVIERRVDVADAYGERKASWGVWKTLWAKVEPVAAGERQTEDMTATVRRAAVTLRYVAGLTTADRLDWDGLKWNILDLREIGRREGWLLTAEAVQ